MNISVDEPNNIVDNWKMRLLDMRRYTNLRVSVPVWNNTNKSSFIEYCGTDPEKVGLRYREAGGGIAGNQWIKRDVPFDDCVYGDACDDTFASYDGWAEEVFLRSVASIRFYPVTSTWKDFSHAHLVVPKLVIRFPLDTRRPIVFRGGFGLTNQLVNTLGARADGAFIHPARPPRPGKLFGTSAQWVEGIVKDFSNPDATDYEGGSTWYHLGGYCVMVLPLCLVTVLPVLGVTAAAIPVVDAGQSIVTAMRNAIQKGLYKDPAQQIWGRLSCMTDVFTKCSDVDSANVLVPKGSMCPM
jgi:hypothetical protein